MTVNGTLGFNAAATYRVNVDPAAASFATVSGAATLGGATVNASFAPGSYISKQYTILTAGSINGTFGTLANTNLPANFHDSLSYDATHAYLNLDLNFSTPAANTLNGNQNNVANALINFFDTTGGIPMVFAALNANGLSQASGEAATGSQQTTFGAMNQFMGVMTDPFIAGRADGLSAGEGGATGFADEGFGVSAYASPGTPRSKPERDAYAAIYRKAPQTVETFVQRWNVWAAGFGGSQTTDGSTAAGSNNTTSSLFGMAAGADYRFSPNTIAGFALAGGGTSFSVAGAGSGRSDLFQAGAPSSGTMPVPPTSPRRWPMAGRTSPPTAPSPSPAPTACAPGSTPTPSPAAPKPAIVLSAHGSAASASRLTPPDSLRRSSCRLTPSRSSPAPTRLP
jgi:hypothetical protein